MLRSLDIHDLLIIDRLELTFRPGLNVLTGETGAGKSILLDALGFVLGWRGRAELVRAGAEQGEVVAVFDLPAGHAGRAVLQEAGLPAGNELILRRVNSSDGRKTAWVNDRRASGEVLRALSDTLVELHGQQDDRGLLNPRGHRALLDDFAQVQGILAEVGAAWSAFGAARKRLAQAEGALAAVQAEEEFLRHAVAELDKLDPQPGEEGVLDSERRAMQAANRIREDILRAHQALGLDGAEGPMRDALRWLEGVADSAEGRLDAPIEALNRALIELGEAEQGTADTLEALDVDPAALERCEERLFAIRALARKHSVAPDELGVLAQDLRTRLEALDGGAAQIVDLRAAMEAARVTHLEACAQLSARRADAAAKLDAAMAGELAPLKMERALFSTQITPAEPGPEGADQVAFTVATNPGAPAGPLNKIASGGELSRFLLALKVCLTRGDTALTMIFDEIDRGVGGATADAVGRRLARLAEDAQVLVVTHSPQVAARGAHHWRVAKAVSAGMTTSSVTPLDPDDRVDEIARMLAGDTITDAARDAARALLDA
ncbi:DNA repair protein RecN [Defluviimonas sp. 20V17]|uniref:DNA repair protein RecN n=1 Tax=Allgaiera indica TaxID=765699 RepID=A0AAN4ZZG2_9RHOB|nr:DNA repair protein RecN [Allgaiera indica]KDB03805.1 DNA repair protein RecN [Defluviimonas sp. 20V17]GHE00048.1 DNA repair protein RecN [Allgaiera indica]SDW38133.1 DNA replication and repair protein RecN [Allgaiera indica]